MTRWYDWIAAFIVADFILTFFALAVVGDTIWHQVLGGVLVAMTWDIWNDFYCKVRKKMEDRR